MAHPGTITIAVVLAALLSASTWNIATWYFGIPASSSRAHRGHCRRGGDGTGFGALEGAGLTKVIVALFTSPLIGLAAGFLMMTLIRGLARNATPKVNVFFKRAQLPAGFLLAVSHGANDAQKTMGIITLGLVVLGF